MKYIMIVLAMFFLSACDDEPVIDAKYLAMHECVYTGKSFEADEKTWIANGRGGSWKDITNRYYVYDCPPGKQKTLSTVRLVIDTEH